MTKPANEWRATTLGQLGRYLNGRAFKKSEWADRGRPIIRIQNLTGSGEHFNYFVGDVEDRYVARPGDLLVSWAATLGAFIWPGPEAVINQHIFKVESTIDTKFHKYLLEFKLAELMRHAHGSGMVHITRSRFDAVPVRVPPIDEQRRIVDVLEDHLSRLDAANQELSNALARAEKMRTSVILHATGSTVGSTVSLGDIATTLRNGIFVSRPSKEPAGVAILRIGAVRPLRLDLSDVRYSRRDEEELRTEYALLKAGDLLFTRYNGNPRFVGACAVVPEHVGPLTWPDKLIRVVVDRSRAEPTFIAMACSVGAVRAQIDALMKTTSGQTGISGRDLRSLSIQLPTLATQERAVAQAMDALFDVDRMQNAIRAATMRSSAMRRSLLEAAFSGQLNGRLPTSTGPRNRAVSAQCTGATATAQTRPMATPNACETAPDE